ncbi:MAG: MFS transporter [Chloroflexota bacterium]|nr:MFS transporter [Chloroflexota bacterium]
MYFQYQSTFALQVNVFGLSSAVYGALISVNGLVIIFLELPLTAITRRLPTRRVIAAGMFLVALGLALTAFAYTIPLLALTVFIWTLGEIVESPVSNAYIANLAPAHLRGRYQGAYGLVWSIGLILAPLLGTLVFSWSHQGLWLLCGVLGTLAALLVLLSGNKRRRPTPPPPKDEPTSLVSVS